MEISTGVEAVSIPGFRAWKLSLAVPLTGILLSLGQVTLKCYKSLGFYSCEFPHQAHSGV